jgi:hypothetical protein
MSAYINLQIDAGTDFQLTLDLAEDDGTPIDCTGSTFNSQIKYSYYTSNVTAYLMVTPIDAANGTTLLSIDAANTANIPPGRYVYDIRRTDPVGIVSRIIEGIVTVTPQVTS